MATSVFLGEGYVTLTVRDAAYQAAFKKAEKALDALATKWNAAFKAPSGAAAGVTALNQFKTAADQAKTSIDGLVRSVAAMNTAMRGGTARGIASVIRAVGAAQLASDRGDAAIIRAQGQANAPVIRAQSQQVIAGIHAAGRVASTAVRGTFGTVNTGMRTAASVLRTAVSPLNAAIGGLSRIGGSFLGQIGLLAGGYGAGQAGLTAIREAMQLETHMANLGRITQGTKAEVADLKSRLVGLASTMPGVKTADIFSIASMSAKQGVGGGGDDFSAEKLGLFTRDLAKMSVVLQDIPVEMAVERIGRLLTVFELGHEDALRFASAVNALDIASTASAQDILEITTRFAGLAHAFKMTAPQALGIATAVRQAGIPLETGGTAMQQIIARMASKRDVKSFSQFAGMKPKEFARMLDTDVTGALVKVLVGMKRLQDAQGPGALSRRLDKLHLDGARVRGAFLQLLPAIDEMDRYTRQAANEWETLDSIQRGYAEMSKTTAAQVQLFKNNFLLAAAAIGERFLPIVRAAADALGQVASDIRELFQGGAGDAVEGWSDRVGQAIGKVSVFVAEFPTFVKIAQTYLEQFAERGTVVFHRLVEAGRAWMEKMKAVAPEWVQLIGELGGLASVAIVNLAVGLVRLVVSVAPSIGSNLGKGIWRGLKDALADGASTVPVALQAILGPAFKHGMENLKKWAGHGDGLFADLPDPIRPDLSGLTPKALGKGLHMPRMPRMEGPQLGGLFEDLPDKAPQLARGWGQITAAEERLLAARKANADAAEEEAGALRKKKSKTPELTGPPAALAPEGVQKEARKLRLQRQAAARKFRGAQNQRAAMRVQANAQMRRMMGLPPLGADGHVARAPRKKRATYLGSGEKQAILARRTHEAVEGLLPGGFGLPGITPQPGLPGLGGGSKIPLATERNDVAGLAIKANEGLAKATQDHQQVLIDNTAVLRTLSDAMARFAGKDLHEKRSI